MPASDGGACRRTSRSPRSTSRPISRRGSDADSGRCVLTGCCLVVWTSQTSWSGVGAGSGLRASVASSGGIVPSVGIVSRSTGIPATCWRSALASSSLERGETSVGSLAVSSSGDVETSVSSAPGRASPLACGSTWSPSGCCSCDMDGGSIFPTTVPDSNWGCRRISSGDGASLAVRVGGAGCDLGSMSEASSTPLPSAAVSPSSAVVCR